MGKAITTLIVLALIIAGGIWMFNRNDDLALDGNANGTEVEDLGTGGAEEGVDPLEDDLEPEESKG
jgi:hypothetical protein